MPAKLSGDRAPSSCRSRGPASDTAMGCAEASTVPQVAISDRWSSADLACLQRGAAGVSRLIADLRQLRASSVPIGAPASGPALVLAPVPGEAVPPGAEPPE